MTVYTFTILFEGDDIFQERYVIARTQEQAESKIEEYRKNLVSRGFGNFNYFLKCVELENVIS